PRRVGRRLELLQRAPRADRPPDRRPDAGRALLRLRDRGADRRPPPRVPGGGALGAGPVRGDSALGPPLPPEVRRAVPAAGAGPRGARALEAEGARAPAVPHARAEGAGRWRRSLRSRRSPARPRGEPLLPLRLVADAPELPRAAGVLLEHAAAPVAAARRLPRGRAALVAEGAPARRLDGRVRPRQGKLQPGERRERDPPPPLPPGLPTLPRLHRVDPAPPADGGAAPLAALPRPHEGDSLAGAVGPRHR